jgi:hypothetical protein
MPHAHSALPTTRTTILLATWIAFVPAFIGCAKKPMMVPFLQKEHREAYRFTEQDLERVKFYSSSDVVVEDLDAPPGGEGMMLVDDAKPGVAIGSGPGWIRVRFQDSGAGLVFLADPAAHGDTGYSLATEVDGGGYRLVRSDDDRILRYAGRRYRVPIGAFAELVVDHDKFVEFLSARQQNPGRPVQER